MNTPESKLKDLIHIERAIVPANICQGVIEQIEQNQWSKHLWQSYETSNVVRTRDDNSEELDVQFITPELQDVMAPYLIRANELYHEHFAFKSHAQYLLVKEISYLRFNRYSHKESMLHHFDHIHDLFDGSKRGIPVLSFVVNLNEGYEGGDLYFWEDHVVPLKTGDIVIFPSLFLFPHGVTPIKNGVRYSAVSWGW